MRQNRHRGRRPASGGQGATREQSIRDEGAEGRTKGGSEEMFDSEERGMMD